MNTHFQKPLPQDLCRVLVSTGLASVLFFFLGISLLTIPWAASTSVRFANGIEVPLLAQAIYLLFVGILGMTALILHRWNPRASVVLIGWFAAATVLTLGAAAFLATSIGTWAFALVLIIGGVVLIEMYFDLRRLGSQATKEYLESR
jgi:hypothetical protein